MRVQFRAAPDGGRTAREYYDRLLRGWRMQMRLPMLVSIAFALAACIPILRYVPHGQFFAGMMVGGTWGMIVWVWGEPPEYIARWKRGADGERQTAKELRSLESKGWRVFNDRAGERRSNLDHIVIGPPGVFLLETKNLSGVISFEPQGLTTRHETSARNDFTYSWLDGSMRGAAGALKERIEHTTHLRPWVQAVVVLWGDFPQGLVEADRVIYISGERLAEWFATHEAKLSPRSRSLIELALDAQLVAPPATAIA